MEELLKMAVGTSTETEMCYGLRYRITRVPNGWIYQSIVRDTKGTDTYNGGNFVPEKLYLINNTIF